LAKWTAFLVRTDRSGDLSVSSIKLHIRSVFKKLDIRNRAGAAAFAAREGLLEPEVGNSSSRSYAKMACVE